MGLVVGKSNVSILFGYFLPTGSTEHALFGTRDSGSAGSGEGRISPPATHTSIEDAEKKSFGHTLTAICPAWLRGNQRRV